MADQVLRNQSGQPDTQPWETVGTYTTWSQCACASFKIFWPDFPQLVRSAQYPPLRNEFPTAHALPYAWHFIYLRTYPSQRRRQWRASPPPLGWCTPPAPSSPLPAVFLGLLHPANQCCESGMIYSGSGSPDPAPTFQEFWIRPQLFFNMFENFKQLPCLPSIKKNPTNCYFLYIKSKTEVTILTTGTGIYLFFSSLLLWSESWTNHSRSGSRKQFRI